MDVATMDNNTKKVARGERKKRKLLAEYELARSNDAAKRPGQLLDSKEEVGKKARVDVSDTQKLSEEDFKKLKKELAERKKILLTLPRFLLQYAGTNAALSIAQEERAPILMSDLQQLLSYALCGNSFAAPPQRWCQLQKPNRLTNIVTLVVEGVTTVDFFDHEHLFQNLTTNFQDRVELLAPASYGSNVIHELIRICPPMGSKEAIIEKARQFETLEDSQEKLKAFRALFNFNSEETKRPRKVNFDNPTKLPPTDTFPRTSLVLSMYQMVMENYPLPMQEKFGYYTKNDTTTYVATKSEYTEVHEFSPLFAVDCEMCLTDAHRNELTRVAIVNEKLETVFETLVKPRNKIINYLTPYSGITKKLLADVTTTLEDVQKSIQNILPSDAILVGHSLNCDLQALNLYHPYVVDTSVVFNLTGVRHRKSKLSMLAGRFLNEEIQQSSHGHSPVEDAMTTMRLVQLKLSKGYLFGDILEDPQLTVEVPPTVFQSTAKAKRTVAVIGRNKTLASYSNACGQQDVALYKQIPVSSNKETIDRLLESAVLNDFSLAHIDLSKKLSKCKSPEGREKMFKKLDTWIESIFSHISLNGMCSIVFGGPKQALAGGGPCDNIKIEPDESNPLSNSNNVCNIKNNDSIDINKKNKINGTEDKKSKLKGTTTASTSTDDSSTDDSDNNNNGNSTETTTKEGTTEQSKSQEGQIKNQFTRRQNGVVFIRIKTTKFNK